MSVLDRRRSAEAALLDAVERILVEFGHAGITTRRVADAAGVNHGLVHYYFGSVDNLLVRALERFTDRLIVRQRALYESDLPFVEKWPTAMRFLVGRRMNFVKDGPDELAIAIADEIGRPVSFAPVERNGAARAAALIAELV